MIWTLVEPGVAIVASSLVTIRPLLRQIRLRGFESTGKSNSVPLSVRSRSRAMRGRLGSSRTYKSSKGLRVRDGIPDDDDMNDGGHGGDDVGGNSDDVGLVDLEQAYGSSIEEGGKEGPSSSKETAVNATPGPSKMTARGITTTWGESAGITMYGPDGSNGHPQLASAGGAGADRSSLSTPDSVTYVIQSPARVSQDQQTWQGKTPLSVEESDHIQGLTYPSRRSGE